jgi:hypothetical protein
MTFGFTKTSNVLGDLGPTKKFQPNLVFSQSQTKMRTKTHLADWRQKLEKDCLLVQILCTMKTKKHKKSFLWLEGLAIPIRECILCFD